MSRLKILFGAGCFVIFWAICQMPSGSRDVASRQTLSISEEPGRIVLGWSGPVQEPMSERIAAALDRFKSDQRRLVLILNSPGGSVEHGRKVVAAIRTGDRAIDTFVQKAGVCASMCVPIFLAGAKRMADPEAYFMFHQVSLNRSAGENVKRREFSEIERAGFAQAVKTIETKVTDEFFRNDIGIRGVNAAWLARMREKISGQEKARTWRNFAATQSLVASEPAGRIEAEAEKRHVAGSKTPDHDPRQAAALQNTEEE